MKVRLEYCFMLSLWLLAWGIALSDKPGWHSIWGGLISWAVMVIVINRADKL